LTHHLTWLPDLAAKDTVSLIMWGFSRVCVCVCVCVWQSDFTPKHQPTGAEKWVYPSEQQYYNAMKVRANHARTPVSMSIATSLYRLQSLLL
jgi:hypothetical protein